MKKVVIFNVGGALSCYGEFDEKRTVIDLGTSQEFSPVDDFLIPLSKNNKFQIGNDNFNSGKFILDQLFLSHLDNDHISDYVKFREKFHPGYMTCPNDNETQDSIFRIIINFFTGENEARKLVLADMKTRTANVPNNPYGMSPSNPLVSTIAGINLFYINPTDCGTDESLKSGYANNISLVLFAQVGDKTLLIPGDMLKEGMKCLIENNTTFTNLISTAGIDYLIAPHHGLQTSFSEELFSNMAGNKVRLNIISEKVREADSNENRSDVDPRYYSSEYSTGENTLRQNAVKTSMGHIVIDFGTAETEIKQYTDIQDVISEFID